MATENSLKNWVSDRLMAILGYSTGALVQYVIRLAKECSSPDELLGKLVEYGCSSKDTHTHTFAEELFSRVAHKQTGLSTYQKEEKEAALLARKQRTYKMVDAEAEDIVDVQVSTRDLPAQPRNVDNQHKHIRKKTETQESEDDEETTLRNSGRHVRRCTPKVDDNEDDIESEKDRLQDQEERAELERNMRKRDAAGMRKVEADTGLLVA